MAAVGMRRWRSSGPNGPTSVPTPPSCVYCYSGRKSSNPRVDAVDSSRLACSMRRAPRMKAMISWITVVLPMLFLLGAPAVKEDRPTVRFSEHLIAGKYGYAYGLAAADLDGDGDLDLTSVDVRGKPSMSSLFWFENDGKGNFKRHVIARDEPGWFERHAVG